MDSERTAAIEDAFCALEGVSSATLCLQGIVEGIDLAEHPAVRLRLEEPRIGFYAFLSRQMLTSASPNEIAARHSGAIQHYRSHHAA